MRIHYDPIARDLQEQVCQILNSDSQVSSMATFFAEQSLDIDYNVRKSLASQGLAAIVMTPTLALLGHDGVTMAWQCDDLTLQILENPIVNRARLKNLGLSSGTALDVAETAAECLAGPQGGHFGEYSAKQVQTAEQNNLLVVKATFKTTCSRQLSSIVSSDISGNYVEIPFATRDELNLLSSDVMRISASFEGFSTEEIQADISSLSGSLGVLSSRFDGLSSIFQPKGDYAQASSLASYALKSEIPTKTSQLENDASYITSSQIAPSLDFPGLAAAADRAKNADYAERAGTADEVAWENVTGKPDLDALSANARDEANKHSDANLEKAEAYTRQQAAYLSIWTEDNFIDSSQIVLPTEPKYQGYVRNAVSAETAESIDWVNVAGKPEIPSRVSQLDNDASYITSSQVAPSQAYQGYALNAVDAVHGLSSDHASYATSCAVAPWQGVYGKPDLALKSDIPTKNSQLENDSGYLQEVSLSDYVKKDELPSLSGYVTQEYVDSKVEQEASAREASDSFISSMVDEKAWLSSIPTKTSELANDSGFLTQHQSLSDYYTKQQTDDKISQKQDAHELLSRNDQQKIEGDRLVYKLSADEWVNIGELALKSDISSSIDSASKQYVDEKVTEEATARQEADQELRASIGAKANLDQVPTKTSQLANDSGFIGSEQLADYMTKQQTDEAISSALSSKVDAKYLVSEDGKQRIYGNGDVSALTQAPGTYGPWTDPNGNTRTDLSVQLVDPDIPTYVWADQGFQFVSEGFHSLSAAETALVITQQVANVDWTRTYTPGAESWKKEGELALKYGKNFTTLSAHRLEVGEGLSVIVDKDGMRTAGNNCRIGFGPASSSGTQQVVLSPSNDGGIVLDGVAFAQAPIYIDEPYKYDQKTKVATLGDISAQISSQMSSYVSKTDIVPSQMIPGAAETAYSAMKATLDNEGNEIATDYAKKTDLTAKQDKLPYNQYTGLYDISAWGAAQAAYVPWTGVEDKPAAVVLSGTYEDGTAFTFNLQGA